MPSTSPNIVANFIAGSTDALRIRSGLITIEDAHPSAGQYLERGGVMKGLMDLFAVRQELASNGAQRELYPPQLKAVLFKILKEAADRRLRTASEFRKLFVDIPARNFKPIEIPSLDFIGDLDFLPEHAIPQETTLGSDTSIFKGIETWGRNWFVPGRLIIGDDIELMASYASNLGAAAAMRMASNAASFLESNPEMADGGPLFDVAKNSKLADELSATSLATAMQLMRSAKMASGIECALPARFLVVEPGLEYAASVMLRNAGLDTRISLVTLPAMAAGRWYLLGDPEMVPTVGLLSLEGNGVSFEERGDKKWRDGILISVRADFNFVPLGRLGVVQGGP